MSNKGLPKIEKFKDIKSLRDFFSSKYAHYSIVIVITINAIVLGLQTSATINESIGGILTWIDRICLIFFVAELAIKLALQKKKFFKSGWNWFDFIIVMASICSEITVLSTMRVFRILRFFRLFRVISSLKSLKIIIEALTSALPSIGWTFLLLTILYYVFAVVGVTLFGSIDSDHFGNMGKAFFTLFQTMTLDDWSEISRGLTPHYPEAYAYFTIFVLLSSIVILNIVVGIVVNSINEVALKHQKPEIDSTGLKEIAEIRDLLQRLEAKIEKKSEQ